MTNKDNAQHLSSVELVPVTQADRDAAANYCQLTDLGLRFRNGDDDGHTYVQMFAQQRIAAEGAASPATPSTVAQVETKRALEPCPFCGSENIHSVKHSKDKVHPYWTGCKSCGCGTAHHGDWLQSIRAWNTRAALTPTSASAEETAFQRAKEAVRDETAPEGSREALAKCHDWFRRAEQFHQSEADKLLDEARRAIGGDSSAMLRSASNEALREAERHRKMANICGGALTPASEAPPQKEGARATADQVVNTIMDDFNRRGGLAHICDTYANSAQHIRSTIWLRVNAALSSTDGSKGLRETLEAVVEVARQMPRATPAACGSGTAHNFQIEAATVWALDCALTRLDAALAASLNSESQEAGHE